MASGRIFFLTEMLLYIRRIEDFFATNHFKTMKVGWLYLVVGRSCWPCFMRSLLLIRSWSLALLHQSL